MDLQRRRRTRQRRTATVTPYRAKVLSYAPLVFFPLDDPVGDTAPTDIGPNAWHGAGWYGPTLAAGTGPDGYPCPLFASTTPSWVSLYSAAYRAAFPGKEGSLITWNKVAAAATWTDAVSGYWLTFNSDTDSIQLAESGAEAGRFGWTYKANTVIETNHVHNIFFTGWFCVGMTWSDSNNRARIYVNGTLMDAMAIDTWQAVPLTTRMLLGDFSGNDAWSGYLANFAMWNSELPAATMADLAIVPGLALESTAGLTTT
jgi:hypothetical protein